MDNVFKHLKRKSKQIISLMLVFCILTENPLSAYASTKATPSNIPESSASIESTDTNIDIDTDFGVEDFETNPDQDPDHGPGIDSTTPTYPSYRPVVDTSTIPDVVKMDSDDIDAILGAGANCIDDFDPGSLVPLSQDAIEYSLNHQDDNLSVVYDSDGSSEEIDAHIAIADDVLLAIGALLAALGVSAITAINLQRIYEYIPKAAPTSSTNIYYWYKNEKHTTNLTKDVFTSLKNKIDNAVANKAISLTLSKDEKLAFALACNKVSCLDSSSTFNPYAFSLSSFDTSSINIKAIDGFKYYYYLLPVQGVMQVLPSSIYVLYSQNKANLALTSSNMMWLYFRNAATANYSYDKMKGHLARYDLNSDTGLYEYSSVISEDTRVQFSSKYEALKAVASLPFPVANSASFDIATQYIETKDALLLDYSNTMRVGSFNRLMDLGTVTYKGTLDDLIKSEKNILATVSGLNPAAGLITDTTTGTGTNWLTPVYAYSTLTYLIQAVSKSLGVQLATAKVDEFIKSYYGEYVHGSAAEVQDEAEEVVKKFVVINGGDGKQPDDDKNNNKYKLAMKFVSALGSFLLTKGFIQSLPEFKDNQQIQSNIQVMADSDPGSNPGTGGNVDLSGILSYLKQIFDVLMIWSNPTALIGTLVSQLDLGSIKAAIKAIPSSIAQALDLDSLFSDLTNILYDWDFDTWINDIPKAFNQSINALDTSISNEIQNCLRLLEDIKGKLNLGNIETSLSILINKVGANPQVLADLLNGNLPANLANALSQALGLSGAFSLSEALNQLGQRITALPEAIADAVKSKFPGNDDSNDKEDIEEPNDSGFQNLLNLLMLALLIIIILLILFINCLRFIVLVFNIPASSALIHSDMMQGIEYMKNLQLPVFGVSLWTLLLSCAYFVIFMTVIAAIRRKIDKMHI